MIIDDKKVVNIASTNLLETDIEQELAETYMSDELVREPVDTLVSAEVYKPSQGRINILNAYNRSLIRKTMVEHSVDDVLMPKNKENLFSQFDTHNENVNPLGSTNVKKISKHIRSYNDSRVIETNKPKARSVTWGAVFKSDRTIENIVRFSGLAAIKLVHLSTTRLNELWAALRKDPFSCLLIQESERHITIIIKISAKSADEYAAMHQRLIDYYSQYFGIASHEFDSISADICRLDNLVVASKVYTNLSSRRLIQLPDGLLKQNVENEQSVIYEPQLTPTVTTSTEQLNQLDVKINNTEIKQSKSNDHLIGSITTLLQTKQRILNAASQPIIFKPAMVSRLSTPIIGHGTINVIQGKKGQHKSRLAQLFASLLIAKDDCTTDFLGFERLATALTVCYVDTERNIDEECANALQSIRQLAGYAYNDEPEHLHFYSLKDITRSQRLNEIGKLLSYVRQSTDLPLFVILDVVTDCVSGFNNDQEALLLVDRLHQFCEHHQATFLLVIHENPGSDKPRGHVGTEIMNKASVRLQISVEDGNQTDPLIKLTYRNLRNGKEPDPVYLQLDNQTKQLQLADQVLIKAHITGSKQKIDPEELMETVSQLLANGPLAKGKLAKEIMKQFDAGDSLVRQKLTELVDNQTEIINQNGQVFILASSLRGRDYLLQPIE